MRLKGYLALMISMVVVSIGSVAMAALPPYQQRTSPKAPLSSAARNEIQARYSKTFLACINKPGANALSFVDCTEPEMDLQDKQLNAVWRLTLARLQPTPGGAGRIEELRKAERLWIKQLEPFCSLAMARRGGMMAQADYFQCEIDETIRRTIWLEKLL